MKSFQKTMRLTLSVAAFFVMMALPVFAAPTKTPTPANTSASTSAPTPAPAVAAKTPDPNTNPVLALILQSGAKLYYLGNQAGLDGWLILKEGQVQMAYAAPDGQHALIGALFGPSGEDITATQVDALMNANPEVKTALTNATRQSVEAQKAQVITESQMPVPTNEATFSPSSPLSPSPTKLRSPGEQLYKELSIAKGVMVGGSNISAPLLFMVVDPNCPHCQKVWRALRDNVFKNTLQVRLIPIGTENTDNERAAAQLLHVADPLNAWNKYVDGDKAQLAGTPDQTLVAAVRANHLLVDNWNLHATPVLVYHGKDGKVKIEQGEPEKINAILSDLGVQANP